MEAVDWTALSVLTAVVVGAVGYLARDNHRRLARLEARMDAGFAAVDRRFEQVDRRFEHIEARLDARFDSLDERYIRHLEAHAAQ